MRHWFRTHWKQLLLLACTLVLGFAVAEVAYRAFSWGKYRHLANGFHNKFWQLEPDSPRVWQIVPNTSDTLTLMLDTSTTFTYHTNSLGLRGGELGPKPAGTRRIVFLGDSYTFGWGLDEQTPTFAVWCERLLNTDASTTGSRVQAVNAGIPGYNTEQSLALLRELGGTIQPDVVVVSYVANDAQPAMVTGQPVRPSEAFRYCPLWLPERVKESLNGWLRPHGWPYFHQNDSHGRYRPLMLNKSYPSYEYHPSFEPDSPMWRDSFGALEGIVAECRRHGWPVIVFMMPDFYHPLGADYPQRQIHAIVSGWSGPLGAQIVDLLPDFERQADQVWRIEQDGHPNAKAHRRLAELMVPYLRGLLAQASAAAVESPAAGLSR